MMNQSLMQQALKRKKANGFDISITIEPMDGEKDMAQGDEENKELGMAPDATPIGQKQDEKDQLLGEMSLDKPEVPGEEVMDNTQKQEDAGLIQEALSRLGRGTMAHKIGMGKKKF